MRLGALKEDSYSSQARTYRKTWSRCRFFFPCGKIRNLKRVKNAGKVWLALWTVSVRHHPCGWSLLDPHRHRLHKETAQSEQERICKIRVCFFALHSQLTCQALYVPEYGLNHNLSLRSNCFQSVTTRLVQLNFLFLIYTAYKSFRLAFYDDLSTTSCRFCCEKWHVKAQCHEWYRAAWICRFSYRIQWAVRIASSDQRFHARMKFIGKASEFH